MTLHVRLLVLSEHLLIANRLSDTYLNLSFREEIGWGARHEEHPYQEDAGERHAYPAQGLEK